MTRAYKHSIGVRSSIVVANMAQYSFPVLENDELLPCMEEMEIPLTAAQLAKPTYDVVGPLFESVLISLTGITR